MMKQKAVLSAAFIVIALVSILALVTIQRLLAASQRVEQTQEVRPPGLEVVRRARPRLGVAEPQQVRRHNPEPPVRQHVQRQSPVGPRADSRSGAVHQHDRLPLAAVVDIGGDAVDDDGPADLGVVGSHGASFAVACSRRRRSRRNGHSQLISTSAMAA